MKTLPLTASPILLLLLIITALPSLAEAAMTTATLYLQDTSFLSSVPPAQNKKIALPQTFTDGSLPHRGSVAPSEVGGALVLRACTWGLIRQDVDFTVTLSKNDTAVGTTTISIKEDSCCLPFSRYETFTITTTETLTAADTVSLSIEPSTDGSRTVVIEKNNPEANSLTFDVDIKPPVIVPAISLLLINQDRQ